jgi:MoaA/NifB/PqqE/SkfB family radical SAM enzyme
MDNPGTVREENRALNEEEIAGGHLSLSSHPRHMVVTVTTRCPIRCIMCYQRGLPIWDLPERTHREVLRAMPRLQTVLWQGGEPLRYHGFEELFHAAAEAGVNQSLFTSGQAMTDDWIDLLVRHRVTVILSAHGTTPDVYEHVHHGASFSDLLSFLRRFSRAQREAGVQGLLKLSVLMMRSNLDQIGTFADFARREGVAEVCFNRLYAPPRSDLARDEDPFSAFADAGEAARAADALRLAGERLSRDGIGVAGLLSAVPEAEASQDRSCRSSGRTCTVPWQWLFVDAEGLVKPHCACRVPLGSAAERGLSEMWNGPRVREYRSRILAHDTVGFCNPACRAGLLLSAPARRG